MELKEETRKNCVNKNKIKMRMLGKYSGGKRKKIDQWDERENVWWDRI